MKLDKQKDMRVSAHSLHANPWKNEFSDRSEYSFHVYLHPLKILNVSAEKTKTNYFQ